MADDKSFSTRQIDVNDYNGLRTRVVELLAKGKSVTYIAKATGERWEKIRDIALSEYRKQTEYRDALKMEHVFATKWAMDLIKDRITDSGEKWDRRDLELLWKWHEHNAKLHGFNAPTEHKHDVTVQIEELSDDELVQQLKVVAPELFTSPAPKALPEAVQDAEYVVVNEPPQRQSVVTPQAGPSTCGERPAKCEEPGRVPEAGAD